MLHQEASWFHQHHSSHCSDFGSVALPAISNRLRFGAFDFPKEKKIMKRKMLWYAFLALTMLLTACGGAMPAAPATQAAASNTTPQKGGEMIVAYKDDLATLDPAIGYDWTNWPAIKMVFD